MGNSTITLQETIDTVASMGDVSPQANPGEYAITQTLAIANDTINDLIAQRFNWKWNRAIAKPFLTNSYQQDYPQIGLRNVGWVEGGFWVDINNTALPQPNGEIFAQQDIKVTSSRRGGPVNDVCWLYNKQMNYGAWGGAGAVYTPLKGATPAAQNPPFAFIDVNGNILTLTQTGTAGATQPAAAAAAAEGTTVNDGSCIWTVCDPNSRGWRIGNLPPAAGPVYQANVVYQMIAPKFTTLTQTIDPIPDDYAQHFRKGIKAYAHSYSADAKARSEFAQMHLDWMASMDAATKQGNKEPENFMLLPATQVFRNEWSITRNPRDPGQPY